VNQSFHGSYNDYLKEEAQATKYSNHHTISLTAHTAKTVAEILREKIE
jgi:hypothetical protein